MSQLDKRNYGKSCMRANLRVCYESLLPIIYTYIYQKGLLHSLSVEIDYYRKTEQTIDQEILEYLN